MKSLLNAFLVALIISGFILVGTVHFGGAQNSAIDPSLTPIAAPTPTATPFLTPTPTPTLIPNSTSTPTVSFTPAPSPSSTFPSPRTNVSGIITSDATWTKANSPYNLTGPVFVKIGAALTIEPGTTVQLNSYYLQINGTLNARGTSIDPINFNGGAPIHAGQETMLSIDSGYEIIFSPSSTSWNQKTQSGSIIENVVIENLVINGGSPKISKSSLLNIDVFGGSPEISNNNIVGGIGLYAGSALISNNIISQQTHYFFGVIAQRYDRNNDVIVIAQKASPVVSNNVIIGNISQAAEGIGFGTENATIINNTIYGCYGSGIGFAFESIGNAVISDNVIYDSFCGISLNDTGLIDSTHTTVTTIQRNIIRDNTYGIDLTLPAAIENNTIENNLVGIVTGVPLSISYNNIEGNNQSVYLSSSNNVNATHNWWGTTDIAVINQSIHDFKNDFNLGNVSFVPILDAPNSQATPNVSLTPLPTLAPTQTPSQTSTPQPGQSPSQAPTTTPTTTPSASSSPSQNPTAPSSNDAIVYEILIVALVILIVAFVIVLAALIRGKRR